MRHASLPSSATKSAPRSAAGMLDGAGTFFGLLDDIRVPCADVAVARREQRVCTWFSQRTAEDSALGQQLGDAGAANHCAPASIAARTAVRLPSRTRSVNGIDGNFRRIDGHLGASPATLLGLSLVTTTRFQDAANANPKRAYESLCPSIRQCGTCSAGRGRVSLRRCIARCVDRHRLLRRRQRGTSLHCPLWSRRLPRARARSSWGQTANGEVVMANQRRANVPLHPAKHPKENRRAVPPIHSSRRRRSRSVRR